MFKSLSCMTLCLLFFSNASARNLLDHIDKVFDRTLDYFEDRVYDDARRNDYRSRNDDYRYRNNRNSREDLYYRGDYYNDDNKNRGYGRSYDDDRSSSYTRGMDYYNRTNSNYTRSSNLSSALSKKDLRVKNVCISPDGTRTARIITNGKLDEVVARLSNNNERIVFRSALPVEGIYFVGNDYLICLLRSRNSDYCHLKSIRLNNNGTCNIEPTRNASHMTVIPSKLSKDVTCISYDGNQCHVHSINIEKGTYHKILDGFVPPVLDKYVQPRIYYKHAQSLFGETSGYDVFAIPEDGHAGHAKHIDHINDISKEMYVAVIGNYCHKLSINDDNEVELKTVSLNEEDFSGGHVVGKAEKLSDCRVNLDAEGEPLFITIGSGNKRENVPLVTEIEKDLNIINKKFGSVSWYRVGATADGNLWILCSCTEKPRYFLYNAKNKGISEIQVNDTTKISSSTTSASKNGGLPFGVAIS